MCFGSHADADPFPDGRADPFPDGRADPCADGRADPRADGRADPRADGRADPGPNTRTRVADVRASATPNLIADTRPIHAAISQSDIDHATIHHQSDAQPDQ